VTFSRRRARSLAFAGAIVLAGWHSIVRAAEPEPRAYDGPGATPASSDAKPVLVVRTEPETQPASEPTTPAAPVESTTPTPPPPRVRPLAEPRQEVRVRLGLDLALTLGVAAPTAAMGLWVEPSLPDNVPMPGETADVGKFDSIALGRFDQNAKIASDILLAVTIATPLVYHAIEAGVQRRGYSRIRGRGFLARYGTDLVILAEAIAINALVTQILKTAVRRPRPYNFINPDNVPEADRQTLIDAQSGTQADWSFPSGHTSTAFTATTAGAMLLTIELLGRSKWAIACAWIGGTGLAATTGVLRVAAGRHYPSDVVTSALLGIGVGLAVPLAHWKPTQPGDRVDLRRPRNVALGPFAGRDVVGLRLGGALY
jgi:membrane-associated phospholipid phosphatase